MLRVSFQNLNKLSAHSPRLVEMEDHNSLSLMISRIHVLDMEEWYITNLITQIQTHNIMNLRALSKVVLLEDKRMATADQFQLSMEPVPLDSTKKVPSVESGYHTNLMVNSPTHKESMMEVIAQQELKLQVSMKELARTELF